MTKIIVKPINKFRDIYTGLYGLDPELNSKFKVTNNFESMNGLLKYHILEFKFIRKLASGAPENRQSSGNILCTSNFPFINEVYKGFPGNFNVAQKINSAPKHPKEWYIKHNVVPTWDIVANDIRLINLDRIQVLDIQPFKTPNHLKAFMIFFRDYVIQMNELHKDKTKIPVYVEDVPNA